MGLDWAHPQKTDQQFHQACAKTDSTGEEEPRSLKEELEENRSRRGVQGRTHLETDLEVY